MSKDKRQECGWEEDLDCHEIEKKQKGDVIFIDSVYFLNHHDVTLR